MLTDDDDLRHAHESDPRWRESLYWNFLVPEASLGGVVYFRLDPNASLLAVMVIVYRGFEAAPAYLYLRTAPAAARLQLDDVSAAGLHIRRLEPLRKFHLTFADGERANLQLTFSGIHTPFDYARDRSWTGAAVATNRFEQAGRLEGRLHLADQEFAIAGFGQRDHSWGVRDWDMLQHYKWFAIQAGEKLAVHLAQFIIRGEVSHDGYVFDGAEPCRIVGADIRTTFAEDGITQRHIDAAIRDERGTTTAVEGSMYALTEVPMERSLLLEGAGRFVVNGQPATGIAEYLWPAAYVEHAKRSALSAPSSNSGS